MKNKKFVRIYIEGGATGSVGNGEFRKGWNAFLGDLDKLARDNGFNSLKPIRGLSRSNAFSLFKSSQTQNPDDLCVLLVDSEDLIKDGMKAWDFVAQREGDKWKKPDWATEDHLYLMKATVETWLLTDQDALKSFFGKDFNAAVLPTTELEMREKKKVDEALVKASQPCKKKNYRHGDANQIIGKVKPEKVQTLSHGKRFFEGVSALIKASK